MQYFGIEIYDGIPLKDIEIDDTRRLEDQWWELSEDITCIDYKVRRFEFSLGVNFHRGKKKNGSGTFSIVIIEGPVTKGDRFFHKSQHTMAEIKRDMQEAADLIHKFKLMTDEEILSYRIPLDHIYK
jgi:hypothetical protein